MSVAILLAEATLLPKYDLSLFSILINLVNRQEVLVQVYYGYLIFIYFLLKSLYSVDMSQFGIWANDLSSRSLKVYLGFIADPNFFHFSGGNQSLMGVMSHVSL